MANTTRLSFFSINQSRQPPSCSVPLSHRRWQSRPSPPPPSPTANPPRHTITWSYRSLPFSSLLLFPNQMHTLAKTDTIIIKLKQSGIIESHRYERKKLKCRNERLFSGLGAKGQKKCVLRIDKRQQNRVNAAAVSSTCLAWGILCGSLKNRVVGTEHRASAGNGTGRNQIRRGAAIAGVDGRGGG